MPARLRDIIRVAKAFGIEVTESRGGSSHYRARRDGTTFPLAAHNGPKTEIADVYLRKLCETYGLDFEEFKRRL